MRMRQAKTMHGTVCACSLTDVIKVHDDETYIAVLGGYYTHLYTLCCILLLLTMYCLRLFVVVLQELHRLQIFYMPMHIFI